MSGRPFRRVCAIGIPGTDPVMRKPRYVLTDNSNAAYARGLYARRMRVPVDYVVTYRCASRMGWIAGKYPPIYQQVWMKDAMITLEPDESMGF